MFTHSELCGIPGCGPSRLELPVRLVLLRRRRPRGRRQTARRRTRSADAPRRLFARVARHAASPGVRGGHLIDASFGRGAEDHPCKRGTDASITARITSTQIDNCRDRGEQRRSKPPMRGVALACVVESEWSQWLGRSSRWFEVCGGPCLGSVVAERVIVGHPDHRVAGD